MILWISLWDSNEIKKTSSPHVPTLWDVLSLTQHPPLDTSPNIEDDCTVVFFFLQKIDRRETGCCSVTHLLGATLVAQVTNMDVSLKEKLGLRYDA